jgi:hypothetical protein
MSFFSLIKKSGSPALMALACNLATQEAEIRTILVPSQPGTFRDRISEKKTTQKQGWAGGVAQSVGPELKPHN